MRKTLLTLFAAVCGAVIVSTARESAQGAERGIGAPRATELGGVKGSPPESLENWPQWRGPQLNGVSGETSLPRSWSPSENIAWKLPTPSRTGATPIIWGDRIFLNVATAEFTGDLELWAVDRNKKDVVWKKPIASGNKQGRKQNMSSPSPVTDGRTVWVMTGVGVLKA